MLDRRRQVRGRIQRRSKRSGQAAFTLIEMLVALAITLIMMGAVVSLFSRMSNAVSQGRSAIEMSDRLRAAANTLRDDLEGMTASMTPPLRPEADEGYFEYLEGGQTDSTAGGSSLFGDTDDGLMFTTRGKGPFLGRFNTTPIESKLAEVAYFLVQNGPIINAATSPPEQLYTLYRRVMLIAPAQAPAGFSSDTTNAFYNDYDVSAHVHDGHRDSNTLSDLTKPENRFLHTPTGTSFPFRVNAPPTAFAGSRLGDDVLLTNVLAFDVQVYDPQAPIFVVNGIALEPRDQGWKTPAEDWASAGYPATGANAPAAIGAYVDLGYGEVAGPDLEQPPLALRPNALCGSTARPYCYDTWSLHYESDGLAQVGLGLDLATNGVDDDGDGTVDENPYYKLYNQLDDDSNGTVDDVGDYDGESDTLPPYPAPLRGMRVTIRVYEPSSKQVRESVIVQDF